MRVKIGMCQIILHSALIAGIVGQTAAGVLHAGTASPVQSLVRPLGLDVAGRVNLAGSDERAREFQQFALPKLLEVVRNNLPEQRAIPESFFNNRQMLPDRSALTLDPAQLRLDHDANVRVYFVGEGAGYANSLGFYTSTGPVADGTSNVYDQALLSQTNAELIFPNSSSNNSLLNPASANSGDRTASAPLQAGDFVDLGKMTAGTLFTPFIISNGASGGMSVFTPVAGNDNDHLLHFVALAVTSIANNPFLLFGVEDLRGGGDRDYNDVIYAVDLGAGNMRRLASASVPVPTSAVALIGPLMCGLWSCVRRRQKVTSLELAGPVSA